MRRVCLGAGLVIMWALVGWSQTYGPGEIQYGGITLRFSGRLTTAGACSPATQPGPGVTQIHCQVPEGVAGTIDLTATRTPAGAVNIRADSVPAGWLSSLWTRRPDGTWVDSRSPVASGWGTVAVQYPFTPPAGSAGRRVELRFKAQTTGVIGELELRVILDIVRAVTPTPPPTEPTVPPSYGPFSGTTDGAGRFEVPIPTLPNTSVTGKLTECTVKPLPNTPVSITLVPKPGATIRGVGDIGSVRVASPGYIETEIVQPALLSSMDMWGRTYTTADVGTVCLRPTAPVTPPPVTPTGPISGKTGADGKFTVSPLSGTTVTGTLTECGKIPLPNQTFTLALVPKGEVITSPEDIAGFTFSVPGYAETPVTQFSKLTLFGLTWYDIGTVCLPPPCTLIIRGKVDDGAPHSGPAYPISKSKVWLFVLDETETLPLRPLSDLARRPTAETQTNHTNERSFDGTEFSGVEEARYEFRLPWSGKCPPRIVVVSLLWYDERDLMAVSSENRIGGRLVPIYLAKLVASRQDSYLPHLGTAGVMWQQTGPNEYTATVDFSYGRDPLARDSARVIGAGDAISEDWRPRPDPDVFMRNCAHFYFYSYKAMRYIQKVAAEVGVGVKPVAVSMFTGEGTSCSSGDVQFGRLAGGPEVTADAQVFIMAGGNDSDAGDNEKPDNTIWHELGHYWWLQIYGRFLTGAPPPDNNHGGYGNGSTTDSLMEGFAEFTSMLIAEYYGDPRPYMYRWAGHNTNLELDRQLWGPFAAGHGPDGQLMSFRSFDPSDEEFAIAGLLWDLHDGGDLRFANVREVKARGVISTQIQTEDIVNLSDAEIFMYFSRAKPRTLKELYDVVHGANPGDSDRDGVSDVGEIFIAHGAFGDVVVRNLRHDAGEDVGTSGHSVVPIPVRLVRHGKPVIPQAYLHVRLVDGAGREVEVTGATMRVDMRFAEPFGYYDYQDSRPLTSERIYFVMPSNFYRVTAFIIVVVPGVGRSEPLVLTNERYWDLFVQAGEAGLDYLLEHTFVLVP